MSSSTTTSLLSCDGDGDLHRGGSGDEFITESRPLMLAGRPTPPIGVLMLLFVVATAAALGGSGALGSVLPCGAPAASPCVRVLFVGNSYTYMNDLPAVFRELASSNGKRVETGMLATGGATLADHAASEADRAAMTSKGWQFEVLQEQSEIPAVDRVRQQLMYPAGRTLASAVRSTGARLMLFETWAHADGWPDYGLDYVRMQQGIDAGYAALGTELGATVVPAGEAWSIVHSRSPGIPLWEADGSHPTGAGTYLAAAVFYATLFSRSPVGSAYTPGLAGDTARQLQAVAAEVAGVLGR